MMYWSVTKGHPLLSRVGVETHDGWDVRPAHAFSGHMPRLVHTLSQHSSWLTLPAETAEAAAADAERVWRVALGVPLDVDGCPFCGGEGMPSTTQDGDRIQHVIRCRSCAAEGPWRLTPEGASKAWSQRLTGDLQEALDKLQARFNALEEERDKLKEEVEELHAEVRAQYYDLW